MIKEEVKESQENKQALQNGNSKISHEDISVRVVTSLQEFESLSEDWEQLTETADSYIFETFDWNRIWWKHFGANKKLQILLFEKNHRLVGIAPLFLDTFKVAGREVYRCLRFIGSTVSQPEGEELLGLLPYSDYLDFIIHPQYEEEVISEFLSYISANNQQFEEVVLDEVPEKSKLWEHLVPSLKQRGYDYTVEESSGCPIIKLGDTWEEHLSSKSKSSRYRTRRYVKKATKPDYKIFEFEKAKNLKEVEQAYDRLVKLHQERWEELGFPGTFGEQRMYDFFKEISSVFFKKGWSEFKLVYALEDDNNCVAVDLIFKYKDRTYLVHRALDADSPSVEESPGNVGLYMMVKEAIEEKKSEFDLLRGTESYKFRSANDVLTNRTITINSPGKGSVNAELVKKYIRLKRRSRLEFKQCKIFLNHEGTLKENIQEYGNFVYDRISRKLETDE